MIIDSTGIRQAPSKLEAIEKMPPPSNVEELRGFPRDVRLPAAIYPKLQHFRRAANRFTKEQRIRVEKRAQIPNCVGSPRGRSLPAVKINANVTHSASVLGLE